MTARSTDAFRGGENDAVLNVFDIVDTRPVVYVLAAGADGARALHQDLAMTASDVTDTHATLCWCRRL